MTKKTTTIIISLVLLAISTFLLLIFFVFSKQNSNSERPLTITANDIEISIGDKAFNFFSVSHSDAEIYFFFDKQNIIEINENYVKGLNIGSVKVTIKAFKDEKQSQTTFIVKVVNDGFSYKITPISNCEVTENNNLLFNQEVCQFSIAIFDRYGEVQENLNYDCIASNNAMIFNEFNFFILQSSSNCTITINYFEINFILKILCFKNF